MEQLTAKTFPGLMPDVDFTDVNDMAGAACLLLTLHGSGPSIPADAASRAALSRATERWLSGVEDAAGSMERGEALSLCDGYRALHPLARHRPAPRDFIGGIVSGAFEAYIRNTGGVDRYLLFNAISREAADGNRAFLGRHLQWLVRSLDQWHRQFRPGHAPDGLPAYDTARRVAALLTSDLWAFETTHQDAYKRSLLCRHLHLLDPPPDTDLRTLAALDALLLASLRHLPPSQYLPLRASLHRAILLHPSTNRHHRAALRLSASLFSRD